MKTLFLFLAVYGLSFSKEENIKKEWADYIDKREKKSLAISSKKTIFPSYPKVFKKRIVNTKKSKTV